MPVKLELPHALGRLLEVVRNLKSLNGDEAARVNLEINNLINSLNNDAKRGFDPITNNVLPEFFRVLQHELSEAEERAREAELLVAHAEASVEDERRGRERAEEQVLRDQTTGLWNREGFSRQVNLHLRDRRVHAWGLFYTDLREFKPWNDVHSHDAGNAILQVFGRLISERLLVRSEDESPIAGRLGGDEFAILVPLRDAKSPREGLEAIRIIAIRLCHLVDTANWILEVRKIVEEKHLLDPFKGQEVMNRRLYVDVGAVCWFPEQPPGRATVEELGAEFINLADLDMLAGKDTAHGGAAYSSYLASAYWWNGKSFQSVSGLDSYTNLPILPARRQ
ncbi:MAG: GGDEF domain-containing protein [Candidatus Yanofskybacteria bacterium]|nr:GGDEF domain-containing protein [Candidatus Yanofskybacteria bacterium]